MKITVISASPREESITIRVAYHLINWLKTNTTHTIEQIYLNQVQLPPLQSVFKSVETTPEQLKPLSEQIFSSDAFIIVTPEYNGSYPATLKNLFDHYPKQAHKTFGFVTASNGSLGGIRTSQQLLTYIPALFGIASPYLLVIPQVDKKFAPDGTLLDEKFVNSIHTFNTEFLWLAERTAQ